MYLLINTIREKSSIALFDLKKEIISNQWDSKNNQSEGLLIAVDKMLMKSKQSLKNLKGVGVINGPGSYTGIRVGVGIANALAYSLQIDVLGISILELMSAYYFSRSKNKEVIALMHAIYDKFYYARYAKKGEALLLKECGNEKIIKITNENTNQYIMFNEGGAEGLKIENCEYFNEKQRRFIEKYFSIKFKKSNKKNKTATPFYLNKPKLALSR